MIGTQLFLSSDESTVASRGGIRSATARVETMNRYLLFTYYVGRPLGGMKDFLDSFDSMAEALENLLPEPTRYFQIIDRETLETVKEGLTIFKDCNPESFSKD